MGVKAIATEHDLKTKACSNVLNSLVIVAAKEVKKTGVFTIPGVCRIKTRVKPASKAGRQSVCGCCAQEADLDRRGVASLSTLSEARSPWESHSTGLKGAVLLLAFGM